MSKIFSSDVTVKDFTFEDNLEMNDLSASVEAYVMDIENKLAIIDDALLMKTSIEERIEVSKLALDSEPSVEYLELLGKTMSMEAATLGATIEIPEIDKDDTKGTLVKYIASSESFVSSTIEAIKSFFKAIYDALAKLGNGIIKFFKLKEKEVESNLAKIEALDDIDAFDIKDISKFRDKFSTNAFLMLVSNCDVSNETSLNKFIEAVKENGTIFKTYTIFVENKYKGKAGEFTTPGKFNGFIDSKVVSKFGNSSLATATKEGDKDVKSNFVYSVGPDTIYIATLFEAKGDVLNVKARNLHVPKDTKEAVKEYKLGKIEKSTLMYIEHKRSELIKLGTTMGSSLKEFEKTIQKPLEFTLKQGDLKENEATTILKSITSNIITAAKNAPKGVNDTEKVLGLMGQYLLNEYKQALKKK